jgi:hypothetical protein
MSTPLSMTIAAAGLVVLCGCTPPQTSAVAPEREPDCSFRSASTCWTMASRFPAPRPEPRDSVKHHILDEPPARLASGE